MSLALSPFKPETVPEAASPKVQASVTVGPVRGVALYSLEVEPVPAELTVATL